MTSESSTISESVLKEIHCISIQIWVNSGTIIIHVHLAFWPGTVLSKFCLKSFPSNCSSIWTIQPEPDWGDKHSDYFTSGEVSILNNARLSAQSRGVTRFFASIAWLTDTRDYLSSALIQKLYQFHQRLPPTLDINQLLLFTPSQVHKLLLLNNAHLVLSAREPE